MQTRRNRVNLIVQYAKNVTRFKNQSVYFFFLFFFIKWLLGALQSSWKSYTQSLVLYPESIQKARLFSRQKNFATLLLSSMLTIILSRSQSSTVFLLNNNFLIYTVLLCFCSSYYFYLAFSCTYFNILRAYVLLFKFLVSERFYFNCNVLPYA